MNFLKYFIISAFLLINIQGWAQSKDNIRYIEVRGSAEMEIEPDEMKLFIGIEEYWKEEFQKNKKPEDYKTKVPLSEIEDNLIKSLQKAGIQKEDIKVYGIGNYWRQKGKEFLFSKQLEVKIDDFKKINQLSSLLDAKGIKYLNIGELSHSEINNYRNQVKRDALKDARNKAAYLVESLDEELGEVLLINEVDDGFFRPYLMKSVMADTGAGQESVDQIKNITVSYQVTARFKIK